MIQVIFDKELAQKHKYIQSFDEFKDSKDYERLASQLGMTVVEMINEADFLKVEIAYKLALGESLVRPEHVLHLGTQMRRLHG
jgi:hypothetical protein